MGLDVGSTSFTVILLFHTNVSRKQEFSESVILKQTKIVFWTVSLCTVIGVQYLPSTQSSVSRVSIPPTGWTGFRASRCPSVHRRHSSPVRRLLDLRVTDLVKSSVALKSRLFTNLNIMFFYQFSSFLHFFTHWCFFPLYFLFKVRSKCLPFWDTSD